MTATFWKINTQHDETNVPYPGVPACLRSGYAVFGWSFHDSLDLREIKRLQDAGEALSPEQTEAATGMQFLTDVKEGDLLVYTNQSSKKKMIIVEVTGEYEFAAKGNIGNDFRSFRACRVLSRPTENMILGIPPRGRIAEILKAREGISALVAEQLTQ